MNCSIMVIMDTDISMLVDDCNELSIEAEKLRVSIEVLGQYRTVSKMIAASEHRSAEAVPVLDLLPPSFVESYLLVCEARTAYAGQ
jgi:hypothetical protein